MSMYPETNPSNLIDLDDQEALQKLRTACKIASQARDFGASLIKPGAKLIEILDAVEEKIKKLGALPGFPAQINKNDIAAHYCSAHDDKEIVQDNDILKFDCGTHVDGFMGDTARTVYVGKDPQLEKLKLVTKKALDNAIKYVKPGVTTGELGKIIGETIANDGFKPIKNLSGHGLGRYVIHTSPNIPNFANNGIQPLKPGMVIAIEPFASTGAGMIYEGNDAEVFMVVDKKPVRNLIVKQLMQDIDKFKGLPFAPRWLMQKHTPQKVLYALNELQKMDIIRAYPPLIDKDHGLVSQHEHTLLVTDNGCEVLTREV